MNPWPPHPDDEWVDVTPLGAAAPRYILGVSGAEREIAAARAKYLANQITVEQFEEVVDRVARPRPDGLAGA